MQRKSARHVVCHRSWSKKGDIPVFDVCPHGRLPMVKNRSVPFFASAKDPCWLASAVPSFVRIDQHDKSISNKTLQYRPGDPVLLFSL